MEARVTSKTGRNTPSTKRTEKRAVQRPAVHEVKRTAKGGDEIFGVRGLSIGEDVGGDAVTGVRLNVRKTFLRTGIILAVGAAIFVFLAGCAAADSSNRANPSNQANSSNQNLLGAVSGAAEAEGLKGSLKPAESETEKREDFSRSFNQPIEIICPWAAGGSADVNARTIGQVAGEKTGQTVTVSNRTGGGGAVGFKEQMEAEPDGYTLGIITAELNTLPPQGKVDFTQEDFYPIIRMNTLPACVAVAVDAPYTNLEELISYAKDHPGALRTGNVGEGSIWHICAAKLERAADISLSHRSYDGASSAAESLVAGELDMVTLETSVMQTFVENGQVRILAVMAEERLNSFPDYPTCKELGYPVVSGSFQGIVCPMEVPKETKDALERLFTEAYQSEAYQNFCESYGLEKSFLNSAEFRTFLEEDLESVTKILKDLDLKD